MVIWLLGISGVGKTTLAVELKRYFDNQNVKSCIVDGDIVREFYDFDLGYERVDRIANIKRIMLSAYLLEQNGITPIVSNISPFQELRDFAKNKFSDYVEIYLKKEIIDIVGKEKVYNSEHVVGVDLEFDKPLYPRLTIDTSKMSVEESLKKIIENIGI